VRAVLVGRDLILFSRVYEAAKAAGSQISRVDDIDQLPSAEAIDLALVDWSGRRDDWGPLLRSWSEHVGAERRPRIILFGPHIDLDAHAAARDSGLGPMLARSKLVSRLGELLSGG
jgi:hypothetical protein